MSEIGIITNPHSKLNKRNPSRLHLLSYILGTKGTFAVTHSLDDLNKVAQQFKDSNISILAINGGDGTISRTLTAFTRVYGKQSLPQVALLRGGTMNVLAVNLGIKGSPEALLARLLERVGRGDTFETKTLQALSINDNIGFLYADGSVAQILLEFYKDKTGVPGCIWLGVKLVVSSLRNGPLFQRTIVGTELVFESPMLPDELAVTTLGTFASTIRKLPLGFPLFHEVDGEDRLFQTISIFTKKRELLSKLPSLFLSRKGSAEKLSFTTDHLSIKSRSSMIYTLDGEIFDSPQNGVDINLGPRVEFLLS